MAQDAPYVATHVFTDFPFSPDLQANITGKGFKIPSAIQDQAIEHVLAGRDVIGLANTGTGKTAAFLLPIIERLSGITIAGSTLILAPTRELAQQIDEQFRELSRGLNMSSVLLVGGMSVERQLRDLRRRPQVLIATPGRLKDLLTRRAVNLKNVLFLVLDEADRMLDMGFLPDIKEIVRLTPRDRQTLFFSATMTAEIKTLVGQFLRDPVTVSVRTADTSDRVDQNVVNVTSKEEKFSKLLDLLQKDGFEKVLVFGETKYGVQRLSDSLAKSGLKTTAIHGNKNQSQRSKALKSFRDGDVNILVATDVAARGLDIPNVSHVINYDLPQTYEDYTHRIGRTGRAGAVGKALTFIVASIAR